MSEFKVKFRGVRGSYPVVDKSYMEYGGNTSCVEVNVGGHLIILDAGTGIVKLGDELTEKYLLSGKNASERVPVNATVLLSHIHHDHIQGFTFFRPLHIRSTVVDVFGNVNYNESLAEELAVLLFGKSFPLDLGDVAGNLNIHDINETDAIILQKGKSAVIKRIESEEDLEDYKNSVVITFYRSYAHPQEGVLIYKIAYKGKTLVYATDKESYTGGDRKLANFAHDCDLIIHDSQYTTEDYLDLFSPKQGYGHSTFDMAIECRKQLNAKQLVFYHYDPLYDDNKLNRLKEQYKNIDSKSIFAHEGLEIKLL